MRALNKAAHVAVAVTVTLGITACSSSEESTVEIADQTTEENAEVVVSMSETADQIVKVTKASARVYDGYEIDHFDDDYLAKLGVEYDEDVYITAANVRNDKSEASFCLTNIEETEFIYWSSLGAYGKVAKCPDGIQ